MLLYLSFGGCWDLSLWGVNISRMDGHMVGYGRHAWIHHSKVNICLGTCKVWRILLEYHVSFLVFECQVLCARYARGIARLWISHPHARLKLQKLEMRASSLIFRRIIFIQQQQCLCLSNTHLVKMKPAPHLFLVQLVSQPKES